MGAVVAGEAGGSGWAWREGKWRCRGGGEGALDRRWRRRRVKSTFANSNSPEEVKELSLNITHTTTPISSPPPATATPRTNPPRLALFPSFSSQKRSFPFFVIPKTLLSLLPLPEKPNVKAVHIMYSSYHLIRTSTRRCPSLLSSQLALRLNVCASTFPPLILTRLRLKPKPRLASHPPFTAASRNASGRKPRPPSLQLLHASRAHPQPLPLPLRVRRPHHPTDANTQTQAHQRDARKAR